jgi:hypothetical protein
MDELESAGWSRGWMASVDDLAAPVTDVEASDPIFLSRVRSPKALSSERLRGASAADPAP